MIELRPFQERFLSSAFAPDVRTSALSVPRGNGKSSLAGHVLGRCMTPGDEFHEAGAEFLLLAGSIKQARHVFHAMRKELPGKEYRWQDSSMTLGCTHRPSSTKVNVISSNAKTSMGIVGCPLAVADEPGSWEVNAGTLMYDSLVTAQGKPDSGLRVLMIGTLAPAHRGWWPDLISAGSRPGVHVTALQGDPEKWDQPNEIARCNPLMWQYPESRRVLLKERDEARADTRLKARFLSYRLNVPSGDETEMLLTVPDWKRVLARPQPPRDGPYALGVDLGGGRAWSAAVAVWLNGRVEALAVCPGIPGIEAQEKRDRVPAGTYRRLVERGALRPAEGLRVPLPATLADWAAETWGKPALLVCDFFRESELRDACPSSWRIEPRRTLWSNSSEDIRGLRKLALDGSLQCFGPSADLLTASLSAAMCENDTSGNTRLIKRGSNNQARDDVAAALVLAGGAVHRYGDKLRPARTRVRVWAA